MVHDKWVNYVANVKEKFAETITLEWFKEMQKEYPNEEICVTQEAGHAVRDLLEFCKEARQKKAKVLLGWFS